MLAKLDERRVGVAASAVEAALGSLDWEADARQLDGQVHWSCYVWC